MEPWTAVSAALRLSSLRNGWRGIDLRRKRLVLIVAESVLQDDSCVGRSHRIQRRHLRHGRYDSLYRALYDFGYCLCVIVLLLAVLLHVGRRSIDGMDVGSRRCDCWGGR